MQEVSSRRFDTAQNVPLPTAEGLERLKAIEEARTRLMQLPIFANNNEIVTEDLPVRDID